ncbi:MAG: hypothetical protein ACJ779_01345 [Chloroflexota bacterium]
MAKDEALKRLGGGRWETRDGRFQIEPQSGTWVIVDTTQTNEFGLPLVRGPFGSLGAAKEAIEEARDDGPVESPLADRMAKAPPETRPSKGPKRAAKAEAEPEPEPPPPPPEPKWIRDLRPLDRRKATELIERLEGLGIDPERADAVARTEIAHGLPGVARLAIERHIRAATAGAKDVEAATDAVIQAVLAGEDAKLGVSWRLVDDRGRPIEKLDGEP